jgi:hypothetical protein
MRTAVIVVLALVAPVAADTALRPVVDLAGLDAPCRPLASAPSSAWTWDATISVANCEAIVRTRALVVTPTPASRDALEHAVRPSLELLARVIAHGDTAHRLAAQRARRRTRRPSSSRGSDFRSARSTSAPAGTSRTAGSPRAACGSTASRCSATTR